VITARALRRPPGLPEGDRPLPDDLRAAIRNFPGQDLLASLTPFSPEALRRLANGEAVKMSTTMWLALSQLAFIVDSRREPLREWREGAA
jgi:hypothetical protein